MCLGGRGGTAEKDSFPAAETSLVSRQGESLRLSAAVSRQGESLRLSAASDFSSPLFPPPLFSSSSKASLHSRKRSPCPSKSPGPSSPQGSSDLGDNEKSVRNPIWGYQVGSSAERVSFLAPRQVGSSCPLPDVAFRAPVGSSRPKRKVLPTLQGFRRLFFFQSNPPNSGFSSHTQTESSVICIQKAEGQRFGKKNLLCNSRGGEGGVRGHIPIAKMH